jgi:hypothetical protein
MVYGSVKENIIIMNNKGITLELKKFVTIKKEWSTDLLQQMCLAHSKSSTVDDKESYENNLRQQCNALFSAIILKKLEKLDKVIMILTLKISNGKLETLVERISDALYTHYVEGVGDTATVILEVKHLQHFNASQAKVVEYAKKCDVYLKGFLTVAAYRSGKKIMLEIKIVP